MREIEESSTRQNFRNSVCRCGWKTYFNNIMIAQKMFHVLRTKPSRLNKRIAIKMDMSKSYDRMEWSFIEAVMRKMGFSKIWIT